MMAKRSANVAKARQGGGISTPTIAAIVTIVLLAAVVFGGIFFFRDGSTSAAPIPPTQVSASYPTSVQGSVIAAGQPSAPRTLDVYEDALCPACQQFESSAGQPVNDALNAGKLQVRYHMVNLLDENSRPAGYSTAAGNAIICAAENGAFPSVHASLYAAQPQEGSSGYSTEQLVGLGQAVGAGPGYAGCVQGGTHTAAVAQNFAQATSDPALRQSSGGSGQPSFGTPTLVLDGRLLQRGSSELDTLLAG